MCKLVYRIRATVTYAWDQGSKSIDVIKAYYNENNSFKRMLSQVRRSLINIFKDTDPNQKLLDGQTESLLFSRQKSPQKRKKLQSAANSSASSTRNVDGLKGSKGFKTINRLSHYDRVSKLPEKTEVISSIIAMLLRSEILRDPKFYKKADQLAQKPEIQALIA